jgi:hypothetical protein
MKLYKVIVEYIDKYVMHCLLRASDLTKHNPPLEAW